MITETYTCDKCGKPMQDSSFGMYCIRQENIRGNPCFGDNRIPSRGYDFCKKCFGEFIVPILPIKNV